MTLPVGMVTQKIRLVYFCITSVSQDISNRSAILVPYMIYCCLRNYWWKCTTNGYTCTYGLFVSLRNPGFHRDIMIVWGVWDFFFQNHLKTAELPKLPKLLLVRSYTGSSSEPRMSAQRRNWLPKEVRCSQAGSYSVTSPLHMYIHIYIWHIDTS